MAYESTTLQRKLRTNDPPTKEEAAIVRRVLASSLTQVTALEDEMLQLQNRQNELMCEKGRLAAFVTHHRALLAPARQLLPEILQEIFYHCLPTAHNALMSNKEAPLLFGRICRRWRQIAYSTPELWTSIHIIASPSAYSHHPLDVARREAITSWLSRSGALPLSISMFANVIRPKRGWCGARLRTPNNHQVQPYLDLIFPYARRWKSVFLSLAHFDWTSVLSQLDGSLLPMLQSLHIEGDRPRRRSTEPVDIHQLTRKDSILSAPSLRVISLPTFYSRFLELPVAWNQITGLDLGARSVALADIDKALRLSPSLESCRVSIGSRVVPDEASPPLDSFEMAPLTLPKLRSLQVILKSYWNATACPFLERLTTPALVFLSYEQTNPSWWNEPTSGGSHPGTSQLTSSLCSFLKRLTHPLEELELVLTEFYGASVMKVLPLVPSIRCLSLKGLDAPINEPDRTPPLSPTFPMNDLILSYFIPDNVLSLNDLLQVMPTADEDLPAQSCFCPKLEVLHCVDATFSRQALLKFIRARTVDQRVHDLTHLRRVSISSNAVPSCNASDPEEDLKFEREVKTLEKDTGVLIELRYRVLQKLCNPVPTSTPLAYMGIDPRSALGEPTITRWGTGHFGF